MKPPGPLVGIGHVITLLPMALLWARWMLRLVSTYGAAPLVAGPVAGWVPLLAWAWLRLSWRHGAGAGGPTTAGRGAARVPA
jgi:hypothetical protein